jgi:hypothetical protein
MPFARTGESQPAKAKRLNEILEFARNFGVLMLVLGKRQLVAAGFFFTIRVAAALRRLAIGDAGEGVFDAEFVDLFLGRTPRTTR